MTVMVMRWRKVWRGIKADDKQRESEIDLGGKIKGPEILNTKEKPCVLSFSVLLFLCSLLLAAVHFLSVWYMLGYLTLHGIK